MQLEYVLRPKTNGANPFKIFEELNRMDKDALAFGIKRMHYQTFIQSAYWFAVAAVAKSRAGMRCQVCNSQSVIQTHHRTYDTHGYEHLNMVDLTVLCDNCHGLFHGHKPLEYKRPKLDTRGPKIKLPQNFTLPHSDQDLQMPDGDPIILTIELIDKCRANGSFTNATLRAFGIGKPLIKGWVFNLVGKEMTRDGYLNALKGRFIYKSGPLKISNPSD